MLGPQAHYGADPCLLVSYKISCLVGVDALPSLTENEKDIEDSRKAVPAPGEEDSVGLLGAH